MMQFGDFCLRNSELLRNGNCLELNVRSIRLVRLPSQEMTVALAAAESRDRLYWRGGVW